jgi:hypothetical protein
VSQPDERGFFAAASVAAASASVAAALALAAAAAAVPSLARAAATQVTAPTSLHLKRSDALHSDGKVANRTDRFWHGAAENPLNEGHRPNFRGVRVALGTGYNRVEGNRRALRHGRVSPSHRNPYVPIRNFCLAVRFYVGWIHTDGLGATGWCCAWQPATTPRTPTKPLTASAVAAAALATWFPRAASRARVPRVRERGAGQPRGLRVRVGECFLQPLAFQGPC